MSQKKSHRSLTSIFSQMNDRLPKQNFMGQQATIPTIGGTFESFSYGEGYTPISGVRTNNEARGMPMPLSNVETVHNKHLVSTPYSAIWGLRTIDGISPCTRTGFFSVYDPSAKKAYIGYGNSQTGHPLADVWAFDFRQKRWTQIPLKNGVTPRAGSRAALLGKYIIVFGGYADSQYISDFHLINLETFEVTRPILKGEPPSPRSTPMVLATDQNVFIWGGYNSTFPEELSILSLSDHTWSFVYPGVAGRTAFPYVTVGDKCYITCGSKVPGMIEMNITNGQMELIQPTGVGPKHTLMNMSMVQAGPLLIAIGGKAETDFSYIYAYHIKRKQWSIFYVSPDNTTMSLVDGNVGNDGLFQIPRNYSLGLVYVESERTVYGLLGFPLREPPPIFTLQVGDALGFTNLSDDMLDMYMLESKK